MNQRTVHSCQTCICCDSPVKACGNSATIRDAEFNRHTQARERSTSDLEVLHGARCPNSQVKRRLNPPLEFKIMSRYQSVVVFPSQVLHRVKCQLAVYSIPKVCWENILSEMDYYQKCFTGSTSAQTWFGLAFLFLMPDLTDCPFLTWSL